MTPVFMNEEHIVYLDMGEVVCVNSMARYRLPRLKAVGIL
jgi:hypothetical protein